MGNKATEHEMMVCLYEVLHNRKTPSAVAGLLGFHESYGTRLYQRSLRTLPGYARDCQAIADLPHPAGELATNKVAGILDAINDKISEAEARLPLSVQGTNRLTLEGLKPKLAAGEVADKVQALLEMMIEELNTRGFSTTDTPVLLRNMGPLVQTMRLCRDQSTNNVATISKQLHTIEQRRRKALKAPEPEAPDA